MKTAVTIVLILFCFSCVSSRCTRECKRMFDLCEDICSEQVKSCKERCSYLPAGSPCEEDCTKQFKECKKPCTDYYRQCIDYCLPQKKNK